MTVQELIDSLSNFSPDTPVVVRGYEGGYNSVHGIQPLSMQLNINKTWCYGAHGSNDEQYDPLPNVPMHPVVYLHSYNNLAEEDWHAV